LLLELVLLLLKIGIVSGLLVLKSGSGVLLLKDSLLAFLKRFGQLSKTGTVGHGRKGGKKKKNLGEKREEAMGEEPGFDTKCGGFLSKGIVTGRNARKIGNKQRNFTDGLLGEALALKVHLRLHSFNSSMPFLLL